MKSIKLTIMSLIIVAQLMGCLINLPISNPTLSVSVTETSTLLPTTTPTLTITSTNTLIPTPTWTPLPTLSTNKSTDTFLSLLNSNAGCELPCWLGITPGITNTSEALHFLAQFPFEIGDLELRGTSYNSEYHLTSMFGITVYIPEKVVGPIAFFSSDETVISILAHLENYKHNYQPNQLLKSLGKPQEIYISSQTSSPEAKLAPTILILDYREKGILIWYKYPTIRIGDNLQFCFNPQKTSMYLWDINFNSPDVVPIDEYIISITGFVPKRLEEATTFNLNTFYEVFLNESSGKCIETPANLWP